MQGTRFENNCLTFNSLCIYKKMKCRDICLLVVRFSQTLFHKLPQFLLFHCRSYSLLVIDLFVDCNIIPQVGDVQKHSLCKCILTTYANTTSDKSLHCRGAVSHVDATSSWLSHTVTTTSYTIYCTLLTLIMKETALQLHI